MRTQFSDNYIKDFIKLHMTSNDLIDIHEKIQSLLEHESTYNNFAGMFMLFLNEEIPLKKLFDIPSSHESDLISSYESGVKKFKTKKLIELYNIKVFYRNPNCISYKNKANIEEEVTKILNSYPSLKSQIDVLLEVETSEYKYSEEFLNINNTLPKMITTERISEYSSWLNSDNNYFENFLEDLKRRTINYN